MVDKRHFAHGLPQPDFRALFELAPGLHLVVLPPRFTIVAVSHAYARAAMTTREALLGQSLLEVFPDDPDNPQANGVRHLRASLVRAINSGLPDAMAVQKYSVRRPDLDARDIEAHWWRPLNTPVPDEAGQVRYLIHRVEDVTEFMLRQRVGVESEHLGARAREPLDGNPPRSVDGSTHKRALQAGENLAEELERHVRQRTDQLRRLGADLAFAEERERRQIAQDLHDDLGQTLAAARIWLAGLCANEQADVSRAAREVDALIDRANRSTRSLAAQLAPAILYELGLCPALEWLGQDITQTFGLRVSVIDDGQPKPLSQSVRSILYRATRELLINAAKHARSDSATVHTLREGDRIIVRVSDAGVGFDPAQVSASLHRGMGLVSVRERLSFIGGTAEIRSIPGDGTEAVLSAWLTRDAAQASEGDLDLISVREDMIDAIHALRETNEDALQGLIDALAGHVAVFDAQGHIRCVNQAWRAFAESNGDPACRASGPGVNYLDVCRHSAADDPHAVQALEGLQSVVTGQRQEFVCVYPCHSPDQQRWFMMHAAPLADGSCLVTHIELSHWVDPERMAALTSQREGQAPLGRA
jgi:signal transduction histidine kinase